MLVLIVRLGDVVQYRSGNMMGEGTRENCHMHNAVQCYLFSLYSGTHHVKALLESYLFRSSMFSHERKL